MHHHLMKQFHRNYIKGPGNIHLVKFEGLLLERHLLKAFMILHDYKHHKVSHILYCHLMKISLLRKFLLTNFMNMMGFIDLGLCYASFIIPTDARCKWAGLYMLPCRLPAGCIHWLPWAMYSWRSYHLLVWLNIKYHGGDMYLLRKIKYEP